MLPESLAKKGRSLRGSRAHAVKQHTASVLEIARLHIRVFMRFARNDIRTPVRFRRKESALLTAEAGTSQAIGAMALRSE
jgi:hypothetical protein